MGEQSKKRKKLHDGRVTTSMFPGVDVQTSKPTAIFHPTAPRHSTLSLALPSSILSNAQTADLKSQLASGISRAAAVFCVDEIVVFDDGTTLATSDSTNMLVHILTYLETPQYLRRHLFELHPHLRLAGMLPPLDIPSHLRQGDRCLYREGVVVGENGEVEVGLQRPVYVEGTPSIGSRVTVRFKNSTEGAGKCARVHGEVVHPNVPRTDSGYYWGYNVRVAHSLSAVFTEAPWEGGYDVTIGTSERGENITNVLAREGLGEVPQYQHMLVAFGGLAGLEIAFKHDKELVGVLRAVKELFDFWVNICPGQGSRTIRTDEAIWITLARLKETVTIKGI